MESSRHPLTLRVMQLAKPAFAKHDPVAYDEDGQALTHEVIHAESPRHFAPSNLSEALQLPSSQGKVFLGEAFAAFLNVSNDSHDVVTNVALKIEMQTATQRHTSLADPEACRTPRLEPTQTLQATIKHDIRELGTHALICAVSYTLLNGERRSFRKSFNFEVNQPLDVIPQCTTIEDTVVLEVQVKNQMPYPIHFQSIKFTPQPTFVAQDCNTTLCQDGKTRSVFHGFPTVDTKESRSYLYKLTPAQGAEFTFRRHKAVGKLDIMWRSSMGEFGHLQTSQLERQLPTLHDLELHARQPPKAVVVGRPFDVACDAINFRDTPIDARLDVDLQAAAAAGLFLTGSTARSIGTLQPGKPNRITLEFVATRSGLLQCKGLTLLDTASSRTHPLQVLFQVVAKREGEESDGNTQQER